MAESKFTYRVGMDNAQAVQSLSMMRDAIKSATSAWKAQSAEAKISGDRVKAAEERYKGLSEVVNKQKSYIEALKNSQDKLREAQSKVDQTTEKGRNAYQSYESQIAKTSKSIASATNKLSSLTTQQKKAENSVNYYKSGLAEAQKQLRQTTESTNSYVERLKAEGKQNQANKVQLEGLKSQYSKLSEIYKTQSSELQRIASTTGKTSDAYRTQQIRINSTATSMAKAKTQMGELDSAMRKANPSIFDKIKNKIGGVNSEATKTHKTFKEVFMGSALGNAASNAFSNLAGKVKNFYSEGMKLNGAAGAIEAKFKGMGLSGKYVDSLEKQLGHLKATTNMTGDDVANLQTKMLNWSVIGKKGAMQITEGIAGIGDSSKLTGQQIAQMGAGLMRVGSSGKVTLSSLNRVAKQAPTFYATLAKSAGMSESHLKSLLASGKVTNKQFQQWMANTSKYAGSAEKAFGKTQGGAMKAMQASWQKLEATMTKPIFNAKSSGLQALKGIMTSPELLKGAKAIGNAIAKTLGYLNTHKKDISGIVTDVVKLGTEIGKALWKDFTGIVSDIGHSFGLISGNSKKSGSGLHTVKLALDGLAKNKGAVKLIAHAIELIAIAKLANTANGLLHITTFAKGGFKAVAGLSKGLRGIADTSAMSGIEKWSAKFGQLIGNANNLKKVLSSVKGLFGKGAGGGKLNGLLQSAHSAGGFKNLTTAGKIGTGAAGIGIAVDTATSIVKAIKDKAGSRKQYEDIGTSAGKGIGGAIGLYFGGPAGAAIGAKIGGAVGKWAGDAAKNFQNGWNKKKPPKKFWSLENLGWSTHDMFKKVGKWGQGVAKSFQTGLKKDKSRIKSAWNSVTSSVGKANSAVKKNFNKFSIFLHKSIKKGTDKAGKAFKKGWDYMYKHGSKGTKQIMRSTSKFAKNYIKINKEAGDKTRKNFASFGKRLKRNHGDLFKTIGQTTREQLKIEKKRWSSNWKNINSLAGGIWKGIKSNAKGFYDDLNRKTHGGLGKVVSGFQLFGKKLASFWSGLFSGIKKTFDNVIGGISKTIGGLGSGIGKFFSGKLKVGSLHLANGTDWKRKYPVLATLNDGNDSPQTGNREGILHKNGVIQLVNGRNVKYWLGPDDEVINAKDMATMFGSALHLARGTVNVKGMSADKELKDLISSQNKMLRAMSLSSKSSIISKKSSGLSTKQNGAVSAIKKQVNSLNKAARNTKFGKKIASESTKAVKSLKGKGNFSKQLNKMTKKSSKDVKKFTKSFDKSQKKLNKNSEKNTKELTSKFSKDWKKNWKDATDTYDKWNDKTTKTQKKFNGTFEKGFKSLDSGTHSIYRKFWTSMHSTSRSGLNRVLSVLNGGIGRIDSVIGEFGGNSSAVHKVSKLATGTGVLSGMRRAITKPTLAVLNDGNDSPETQNKETIWDTNTNEFGVVQGRNTPMLLKPGQEVLNATESKLLGFTHLASGTGALKRLYELAKKFWKKPEQTGTAMYSAVSGLTGAISQLAHGIRTKGVTQSTKWWSQLWKMVENKVNSDDLGPASGLLNAVEKLGRGKHYSQGKRMSKFFADCSSLVSRALYNDYGAKWAEPNGWALTVAGLWDHAHRISKSEAKPGDPVFWLPDTHVGIYAGRGMDYSAYGPGDGGPVGMQRVAPGATFGRFNGLNTEGGKSDSPKVKVNNSLQKKIKAQVGAGFWKTVQKIADKYGDNGLAGAFKLGGDVAQRAKALAKAIKQVVPGATKNGLAAIIGSWEFESGGLNPAAINPNGGASGLGQWLSSRLTNLKAFARKHGKSWKDPATQINFAANAEGSDSAIFRRIAKGSGSPASLANAFSREWERGGYDAQHAAAAVQIARALRGYANGGIATTPSIFGEEGPEMAIPLSAVKSSRAYELLGKTISILSARDGSSVSIQQFQEQQKEEKARWDRIMNLLEILVSNTADTTLQTDVKIDGRTAWKAMSKYAKEDQKKQMIYQRKGFSNGI